MRVLDILGTLKNKVLDAANFDLLKTVYELQEENLKQLATSNGLLKEKLEASAERIAEVETQLDSMGSALKKARSRIPATAASPSFLPASIDILHILHKHDVDEFAEETVRKQLSKKHTQIQISAALNELTQQELISAAGVIDGPEVYYLTATGESLLAKGVPTQADDDG